MYALCFALGSDVYDTYAVHFCIFICSLQCSMCCMEKVYRYKIIHYHHHHFLNYYYYYYYHNKSIR